MPETPSTPVSTITEDQARASRLLLALLEDDKSEAGRMIDEANAATKGIEGLLAALASAALELLIQMVGVDGARKTLNLNLLEASLNEGTDDDRPE